MYQYVAGPAPLRAALRHGSYRYPLRIRVVMQLELAPRRQRLGSAEREHHGEQGDPGDQLARLRTPTGCASVQRNSVASTFADELQINVTSNPRRTHRPASLVNQRVVGTGQAGDRRVPGTATSAPRTLLIDEYDGSHMRITGKPVAKSIRPDHRMSR